MPTGTAILASFGTAAGIAMALSPAPTIKTIINTKSVGDFSVFPYIVTACQSALWISYAGVTPGKSDLIPVNVLVMCLELAYCIIFLKFVHPNARVDLVRTMSYPLTATLVGIAISFVSGYPSKLLGFFAVISNIVMYAAPLAVVKTVIETKSVQYMPFLLSFIGTIASVIWSAWALAAKDQYVLLPNVLGVILGTIQLAVYAKYRNANGTGADGVVLRNFVSLEAGTAQRQSESETNGLIR